MKYSDLFCQYLKEAGYTHCFMVAGGNIMHLIGSASKFFTVVPVVNEVAGGIAAEYFNETQSDKRAFVLVTAGPGLTNLTTAVAGAFLESRDLLIIGGQVKVSDLAHGKLRQNGIQEIDGVSLMKSITKVSVCITEPIGRKKLFEYIAQGLEPRKAPVFLEIPLDVQAKNIAEVDGISVLDKDDSVKNLKIKMPQIAKISDVENAISLIKKAQRPAILLGAGVSRQVVKNLSACFDDQTIPFFLTWNAADRLAFDHPLYFGRPNIWGQRYSNILLQQSDLLIAVGTRLGMQQSGFNWEEFIPNGKIIQIDCDRAELEKGHPKVDFPICADANDFLAKLFKTNLGDHSAWLEFCRETKALLPLNEKGINETEADFICPYDFASQLSKICKNGDVVIPCSSGGAFTVMMQIFDQKKDQIMVTNKALASMGYGLSGAIGAALSMPNNRTILVEGDGGFAQNLQEIATVVANKLNLKIFLFENSGYASIRMTQKNYFNGQYVGCDVNTGLGFPNWEVLFSAYNVPTFSICDTSFVDDEKFKKLFEDSGAAAFIVRVDPKQTYFPKINSKVMPDGGMKSNPLHLMFPDLDQNLSKKVFKFL